MDAVYESVMLSNVLEDDERFRAVLDAAVAKGDVTRYKAYADESRRSREARVARAKGEAVEAEEYAKELGVHDKLFGGDKDKKKGGKGKSKAGQKSKENKNDSEDALAALIRGRQKERGEAFLDGLAEKYGAKTSSRKKSKKKQVVDDDDEEEEEPDEEAFQAAAARLREKKNKATEDPAPKATKKSRR